LIGGGVRRGTAPFWPIGQDEIASGMPLEFDAEGCARRFGDRCRLPSNNVNSLDYPSARSSPHRPDLCRDVQRSQRRIGDFPSNSTGSVDKAVGHHAELEDRNS
jgi:hypothetical protein